MATELEAAEAAGERVWLMGTLSCYVESYRLCSRKLADTFQDTYHLVLQTPSMTSHSTLVGLISSGTTSEAKGRRPDHPAL
jgi:phage gp36-like protein